MPISVDFSLPDLERLSWLNEPAAATPTPAGLRVVPHVGDWWSRTADSSHDDLEKRRVDEAAPLLLLSPAVATAAAGGDQHNGGNGDFDLEASLAMFHRRDFDQAGVCVRASASSWLKANVERMPGDGRLVLACVVTNGGVSDLSCCPLDERCLGGGVGGGGGGGGVPSSPPPSSAALSPQAVSISSPPPLPGSAASVSVLAGAGGVPGASAAIRLRVRRRRGDYSVEWAPPPPPTTKTGDGEEPPPPSFTRFRLCRLHEDDGSEEVVSSLRVGVYASAPVAAGFVALFRSLRVGPPESGPLF